MIRERKPRKGSRNRSGHAVATYLVLLLIAAILLLLLAYFTQERAHALTATQTLSLF